MNTNQNDPKEVFRVDAFTEHKQGMVTVQGVVENKSDSAACLKELTALYKNTDGFVVDVDRMKCEHDLSAGEKFNFQFPWRRVPINCYIFEVMVSKFSKSDSNSSKGIFLST